MNNRNLTLAQYNEIMETKGYYDDMIFEIEEINDILADKEPLEILDMVLGELLISHEYFKINSHGHLEYGEEWEDLAEWSNVDD